MTKKAKFIIELDLETLNEMAGIFDRLDIEFDAVENMVCFPQGGIGRTSSPGPTWMRSSPTPTSTLTRAGRVRGSGKNSGKCPRRPGGTSWNS